MSSITKPSQNTRAFIQGAPDAKQAPVWPAPASTQINLTLRNDVLSKLDASFPDRPGITSAALNAGEIVSQAQDALASVLMYPPDDLPLSIEDGARPPENLSQYQNPLTVVIPFAPASVRKAA
jgi:hypothetical protein